MSRRILFLTKGLYEFGDARQLLLLSRELANRDFDVHLATWMPGAYPTDRYDFLTVHPLGHQPRRDWGIVSRLRRLIGKLDPDWFHSWDYHAAGLSVLAGAGRRRRMAMTLLEFPRSRSLLSRLVAQRASQQARIVTCHPSIADHLANESYVEQRDSIWIIPNAVDASPDQSAERDLLIEQMELRSQDPVIVGASAELIPRTRLKDLSWACGLLQIAGYNVHLLIVGTGSQEEKLRRYVRLTDATPYIHFGTDPIQFGPRLHDVDVFWHSHLTRPLPDEMMFAMCHDTPVVSVIGPGTEELIRHQATGFATNYGARDEVARWTKYLLDQPEQARQLKEQARQHVLRLYPLNNMVDQYCQLYDQGD